MRYKSHFQRLFMQKELPYNCYILILRIYHRLPNERPKVVIMQGKYKFIFF